jgi:hypothetical protein
MIRLVGSSVSSLEWVDDLGGKKVATKAKRWYKEVGLGFKTPAEAINGTYIGQSFFLASSLLPRREGRAFADRFWSCRQEVPLHW